MSGVHVALELAALQLEVAALKAAVVKLLEQQLPKEQRKHV